MPKSTAAEGMLPVNKCLINIRKQTVGGQGRRREIGQVSNWVGSLHVPFVYVLTPIAEIMKNERYFDEKLPVSLLLTLFVVFYWRTVYCSCLLCSFVSLSQYCVRLIGPSGPLPFAMPVRLHFR